MYNYIMMYKAWTGARGGLQFINQPYCSLWINFHTKNRWCCSTMVHPPVHRFALAQVTQRLNYHTVPWPATVLGQATVPWPATVLGQATVPWQATVLCKEGQISKSECIKAKRVTGEEQRQSESFVGRWFTLQSVHPQPSPRSYHQGGIFWST